MNLLKKILLSIIWSLIFCFLSAVVFNFLSGMIIYYLFSTSGLNPRENHDLINLISTSGIIVLPFFVGVLGLILSIRGKLPGTNIKKSKS